MALCTADEVDALSVYFISIGYSFSFIYRGPYGYVCVCVCVYNQPLVPFTMVVMPFVFWPLLLIYYEFQPYAMLFQICLRDIDFDPANE